ncbi:hypothetical protein F5884DRAFT_857175 [Xylogone sp. PMI_703]|nr:hypothetical protein F5884DRAFT_857175 [Xylogone sp. PMI_703]
MEEPTSRIRRRARKACLPCASMKAKCVTRAGCSECERCQQQNRPCANQVPKTRKTRKPLATTRVEELEKKVESLVTMIESSQVSTSVDRPSDQSPTHINNASDLGVNMQHSEADIESQDEPVSTEILAADNFTSYGHNAEELLRIYREEISVYFPFIIIPLQTSARSLEAQKPLLWKVIVIIAAIQSPLLQITLGKSVREEIITRLVVNSEDSFELLQALLLYTTWHHQFTIRPHITNLIHLAKALVANLGIDRWPGSAERRRFYFEGNIDSENPNCPALLRSTDERRALLGCLFLDALKRPISHGKIDTIHYSSYVQNCLKVLEEKNEYPSDSIAVHLIRIQQVSQKINQIFPSDEPRSMASTKTATIMCVKALQMELEAIKTSVPHGLCKNKIILFQYYSAEIMLYQVGLDVSVSLEEQGMEPIQRLDILSNCLHAIKKFYDIYYSLHKRHVSLFPFYIWTQGGMFLHIAAMLCFATCPGWDLTFVRNQLCIPAKVDYEITHFQKLVRNRASISESDYVFQAFIKRITSIKTAYENRIEQEQSHMGNQGMLTASDPMLFDDILQGFDFISWEALQNEHL